MNQFEIINETNEEIIELDKVSELLEFALKKEQLDNVEFNIIIINNDKIRSINKEYRNIDRETDVISFALEDNDSIKMPYRLLGDIYISIDKAKGQAVEYGHSLLRELGFLSIHGLLHLLGYDHMNKEDEKIMFERQELILNEFGITKK
ncbi:MAG: rRNA maturation RNase YbeY [Firmicutes bacterium]|nr:rRNA maturation RNase YbeY [Bacillota bacterium]